MKKPVIRQKFTNTRKVLRKEKRQQKKINRKQHYLKKKSDLIETKIVNAPGQFVRRRPDSPDINNVTKVQSHAHVYLNFTENDTKKKKKKPSNQPTTQDILKRQQEKEKKEANKLKSQMSEQRRKMLVEANEDEDKIIKKLEKQLGLNKSRNKNNYFADDGLDYLLEVCERKTSEQIVAAEKHLADVEKDSDFEEDLGAVTGRDVKKGKNNKDIEIYNESDDEMDVDEGMESDEDICNELQEEESEDMSDDNDDDSNFGADDNDDDEKSDEGPESVQKLNSKAKSNKKSTKETVISEEDISKVFSEDEVSHLSDDDDLGDETSNENVDDTNSQIESKQKSDVWEDIYGRKRDKEGNVVKEEKGVYIPPHLRNKDSASDKEIAQLKRQVKSVLNKLTGSNLHWACGSVERLYSAHSRNSVSSVLSSLWREALLARSLTPERLVAEHAALVAVLHANVGSEIGAHFLEELCREFDTMMETPQAIEDKTLDNLVASLAHLYRFKVFDASLLFDVLSRLTHTLTEKNIDVSLVCVRGAGAALRREAPAALRDYTHQAQARASGLHTQEGSRIKYLLDVLLAIKNNNLNKIPNYDPSYVEHLIKITRGIVRKGNYITPLNIRLEDLLKAHERGKWWVVGSAWAGTRQNTQTDTQTKLPTDQKLLELARKQRMNTDVRRSIFCVIMAAEDYMDAFEKLQHLGLKGQQEREVVHVLLACCFQEKIYNPYYSVLAMKLCNFDRKYQLSIQYSVWDKIKELESLSKQAMTNLAQFLIHLIMEKGLPLSILKIIQFSDLNKRTVQFMRQILLAIIMNADLQASLEVFHRISKPPKLHMFRESLRLFIQHFLIKNAGKQSTILNEEDMSTLKERAQEVDKILTMHENKLRF